MFTTIDLVRLVVGILILYWGAEWLIRGSATMARALGVKPLVIALTVMAYGQSAPELAVSTEAVRDHATPIALGTVIGSCAANISLILGLSALIQPVTIDARLIRREVPILLGSAIAVPLTLYDGVLSRNEGIALIGCAVLFTLFTLTVSSRDDADEDDLEKARTATEAGASYGGRARPRGSWPIAVVMSGAGIGLLVIGSNQFVAGARGIAGELGMSERMLGMTIIALGTSLPELIAATVSAARGHHAFTVGSVIGSNLLNVFLVLGVVAYLHPIRVGERMHPVDLIGLVSLTVLAVIFLRGSRRVTRLEGAILVAGYVAFVVCASIF